MAMWANLAYCAKASISGPGFIAHVAHNPQIPIIIGSFGGPKINKIQLETTKFQMLKLRAKGYFKVNSDWWTMLKDQYCKAFTSLIKHGINGIRNGMGSNQRIDIYLTGHRVGGFYAQILGFLLLAFSPVDENVYIHVVTFGSSRPGNYQLAEQINKRSNKLKMFRITYTNEFFPHFPKYSPTGVPYIHPGTEYWIESIDCDCNEPIVYECPGFSNKNQKQYGESLQCNLGTDGTGTSFHDTPYFGTIFEDCTNLINTPNFNPKL
ncbi:hypothetical protein G9A89_000659 [Geosiphon pyriformis]|nr:hypothetical protein G9A89_000659 [Geosiphon pyriformis]